MKIQGSAKDILAKIAAPSRIAVAHEHRPITASLLLKEVSGRISVTGMDKFMTHTVSVVIDGNISANESACIPAHKLVDILTKIGDGNVSIENDSDSANWRITGKNCKIRIAGLGGEDYPVMANSEKRGEFEINGDALVSLINMLHEVIPVADVRYYLNGLLFERAEGDDSVFVVGTDGHRLAVGRFANQNSAAFRFIFPRYAIPLIKQLASGVEQVKLTTFGNANGQDGFASLDFGSGTVLYSKLVEGNFPEWRRVIPSDNLFTVAKPQDISNMVDIALVLADEKTRAVSIDSSENGLHVSSRGVDSNEFDETISEIEFFRTYEASFNGEYLATALKSLKDFDQVELHGADKASAMFMRPKGEPYPIFVVMPFRM